MTLLAHAMPFIGIQLLFDIIVLRQLFKKLTKSFKGNNA